MTARRKATQRWEMFAAGGVAPERLWAVVGDPRRLPEWTDVERVENVAPEPVAVGSVISTRDRSRRDADRLLHWEVVTHEERTLEAVTNTLRGRLGLGVRVLRNGTGSRMVLAGAFRPWRSSMRARLVEVPALRRRFDRWSHTALEIARFG